MKIVKLRKKILKERFELINQGTEKSRIRIRDLKLYVDGQFVASDWLQFSILSLNCRSVVSINKRFRLTNFFSNYMPNTACLSESWLDKDFCDNISLNTHYITAARADRENGTHGAVINFCKSHMRYETISLSCNYACAIKICLSDVVISIICIYNPPKGSPFRVNWNIITERFCCFLKDNPNAMITITGDLNQPAVEWNSVSTNDAEFEGFLDLMVTHSLIQLIKSSSHKSGSILDVLISNLPELSSPPKHIIPVCFSDHYAISAYIEFPSSTVDNSFSPPVYRIPFQSFADFGSGLVSSFFSVSIRTSGEDYVSSWFQQFESIVYQFLERKRKKRVELPWFYTHTVHLHNKFKTASNSNCP